MPVRLERALSVLGLSILLSSVGVPVAGAQNRSPSEVVTVPRLITLNGTLRDRDGKPLSGVVGLRFAVYRDQESGPPLWVENQNGSLDDQGRYTVLLGATSGDGLPLDLFVSGETRWLAVQAILPGEEEQPRALLVSVPYAMKAADADTLGGRPASAYRLMGDTQVRVAASAKSDGSDSDVTEVTSAAVVSPIPGCVVKVAANSTDENCSVIYQSGNNIGIGPGFGTGGGQVLPLGPLQTRVAANVNFAMDPGNAPGAARLDAFNDAANANIPIEIQGSTVSLFGAGGAFGIMVNSSGNVGVQTTNPIAPFQARLGPNVNFAMDPGNGPGAARLDAFNDSATANIPIEIQGSTIGLFAAGGVFGLGVNSVGNVGIGTTNPTTKLEVSGTVKGTAITSDSTVSGTQLLSTGTVSGTQLLSTVATGTAPLTVASTTQIANLNASLLAGKNAAAFLTRGITYLAGCDTCSPLAIADDQKNIYTNVIGDTPLFPMFVRP